MFFNRFALFLILGSVVVQAQYTDQINSNRPGASIGAFAVGKTLSKLNLAWPFVIILTVDTTTLLLMEESGSFPCDGVFGWKL